MFSDSVLPAEQIQEHSLLRLVLLCFFLSACAASPSGTIAERKLLSSPSKGCLINKAAIDIGSETTKFKLAQINTCQHKLVKTLFSWDQKVAYKVDLDQSPDKTLSKKIRRQGISVLQEGLKKMEPWPHSPPKAVATEVFRQAKNADHFLNKIRQKLNLDIQKISQDQEAELIYRFVQTQTIQNQNNFSSQVSLQIDTPPNFQLVVWDIGGGSQQITFSDNGHHIYKGHLASVSFKNYIIQSIQKKEGISPNPLSKSDLQLALAYVRKYAHENLPKNFLQIAPSAQIVGVGGVHAKSIQNQVAPHQYSYTRQQLYETLMKRYSWNDKRLNNPYASTQITNMILVLGFMDAMSIKKVSTQNVNISDALLLSSSLKKE